MLNNVWFEDWTFQEYLVQVIPPDPAREHPQRSLPELGRTPYKTLWRLDGL